MWDGFDDCGIETCDMPLLENQREDSLVSKDESDTGADADCADEPMPVLERSIDMTDINAEGDSQAEGNTVQNVKTAVSKILP